MMPLAPTQQGLFGLIRFLQHHGQTVNHLQHQEHVAYWRKDAFQAANVESGKMAKLDDSPVYPVNRQVTGVRAFETAYIAAMEGKLNQQAKARLARENGNVGPAADDDDGNTKRTLHLVPSVFRAMEEAICVQQKLSTEENMTMEKGTITKWPLLVESSDADKQQYLQGFMEDVNKHDPEVLDWSIQMKLYRA